MFARLVALCLISATLLTPALSHANGAVFLGTGYDIFPVKADDVAMRKEIVKMIESARGEGIEVNCTFWFVNCGDTTTVQMGFPLQDIEGHDFQFRVWLDDEEVEWNVGFHEGRWSKWEKRPQSRPVYLWPVSFGVDQERRIDVSYQIEWSWADLQSHPSSATYVLTTGALWREPIGEADITFQFSAPVPLPVLSVTPLGFEFDGRALHWHRENFLPEENLFVGYEPERLKKFRGRFDAPAAVEDDGYLWDHQFVALDYWVGVGVDDLLESTDFDDQIPDSARAELLLRHAAYAADIRNEIYARHGYRFRTAEQASRFRHEPWYSPVDDFDERDLNEIEQMNVLACRAFEEVFKRATTPRDLYARLKAFARDYW